MNHFLLTSRAARVVRKSWNFLSTSSLVADTFFENASEASVPRIVLHVLWLVLQVLCESRVRLTTTPLPWLPPRSNGKFSEKNRIFLGQTIFKIENQYFFGWFTEFPPFTLNSPLYEKVEVGGLFMSIRKTIGEQVRISLKITSEVVKG